MHPVKQFKHNMVRNFYSYCQEKRIELHKLNSHKWKADSERDTLPCIFQYRLVEFNL